MLPGRSVCNRGLGSAASLGGGFSIARPVLQAKSARAALWGCMAVREGECIETQPGDVNGTRCSAAARVAHGRMRGASRIVSGFVGGFVQLRADRQFSRS